VRTPGEQTAPEIQIDLEFREGRTTWHEPIRIPMNDVRSFSTESRPVAPFPPEKVLLQRRDGSTIQLSKANTNLMHFDTFEERDSQGMVKRTFTAGSRVMVGNVRVGEIATFTPEPGQITVRATFGLDDYELVGFEGLARASTGAQGHFSIDLKEVRRIEFK
jgi:hypothetical protein